MKILEKVGKNQLCNCGSGLKHKRCCYNKNSENILLEDEVDRINKLIERENFVLAEELLNRLIKDKKDQTRFDSEIFYLMGIVYHKKGEVTIALGFIDQAIMIERKAKYYVEFARLLEVMIDHMQEKEEMAKLIISSYIEATNLDSNCLDAYRELGKLYLKIKDMNKAEDYFNKALKINPNDKLSKYFLSIAKGDNLKQTPPEFVEKIFDNYAHDFDDVLTNKLEYEAPEIIANIVKDITTAERCTSHNLKLLDLGCGTGLVGEYLSKSGFIGDFVGVDISEKMLKEAGKKNIYSNLEKKEVIEYLKNANNKFDIITASDVFVYIGNLEEVFKSVSRNLCNNGLFAFTIENNETDNDYIVKSTIRYGHSIDYIKRLAFKYNFVFHTVQYNKIRKEHNSFVGGYLMVLVKEDGDD